MADNTADKVFSPWFLAELAGWSLIVAAAIALIGAFVTGHVQFAVGCLLAAAVDAFLVRTAVVGWTAGMQPGPYGGSSAGVMLVGRFLAKGALLLLALGAPRIFDFSGTVAGVFVFDLTLSVVGSVEAVRRVFPKLKEGR